MLMEEHSYFKEGRKGKIEMTETRIIAQVTTDDEWWTDANASLNNTAIADTAPTTYAVATTGNTANTAEMPVSGTVEVTIAILVIGAILLLVGGKSAFSRH